MFNTSISKIQDATVLVRVCYDLSNFEDIDRVQDSFATIDQLIHQGNKVVLLSHWKRPEGQAKPELSLNTMLPVVTKVLGTQVEFINQFSTGFKQAREVINHSNSQIYMLENTRFEPREASKDPASRYDLAKEYSNLGQYFVDEAFPVSHRTEATNTELAGLLPSAMGLSYQNEVQNLLGLMQKPNRPFVAIMAGAKLETKLPLIQKMLPLADKIIIGGMLAFTFIKAGQNLGIEKYLGVDFGASKVETDFLATAEEILSQNIDKIILPTDFAYEIQAEQNGEIKLALDIGPITIASFIEVLSTAETVFMNGTMGYYEKPPFDQGTLEIADYLSKQTKKFVAVGGGDTNSALPISIQSKYDFVSMGGGATLEFLSGGYNYQKFSQKQS